MKNFKNMPISNVEERLKEIKLKQVELLERQKLYQDQHQLEFFKPHPGQQPVVDALLTKQFRTIVMLGGNRSGKSALGAALTVSTLLGRLPWQPKPTPKPDLSVQPMLIKSDGSVHYPNLNLTFPNAKAVKEWQTEPVYDPGQLRKSTKPVKIRVIGEDYEKSIGQVINPYLEKFIPPEMLAGRKKNQAGVYAQWVMKDGSVIDCLTYAQDSASMEGWDGDWVWFDEPPPRSVYIANIRGLIDRGGICMFTLTPLKEPWIANEIVNTADPSTFVHTISTHDNPHIDQTAISEFEARLSEEEKATRIGGQFLHLQGLVFKEFSKQVHVKKAFEVPRNYTVYVAMDTHPRTQQALLFIAVDQRGNCFVCHEIFQHGTPEQVARWVIEFHTQIHPIHRAIIEPASQGDKNRGDSTFQLIDRALADEQIPLDLGSKDLAGGILKLREAFLGPNQTPSLFIFDNCQRLIWELQNYVWKDWAKSAEKNEMQKPRDADDHLIECMRRIIQYPATFVDPRHASDWLSQANAPYQPTDPYAGY